LLILTTIRRLAILLLVFLVWTPVAYAWSWPVQGPVVQQFSYDEAHPYAAGQHRGIDIGAPAAGESVIAPAAGTVSFAGTVAANGKSVTIETADGYSVTLTHLGSIAVVRGATVAEQDVVGTVGPSGTPEVDGPYVHLGIRVTDDPNGYVDPLGLLPPAAGDPTPGTGSTSSQPAVGGAAAPVPASKPARPVARKARATGSEPVRARVRVHKQERAQKPRADIKPTRARHRPAARERASEPVSFSRPLALEPEISKPIDLGAGHDVRPTASVVPRRSEPSSTLLTLVCDLVAVLFGVGAALGARRQRPSRPPIVSGQVLRLPPPEAGVRQVSRAA
jgi:hypothetical protein